MSLLRPSPESIPSATLNESVLSSVSSVRDSLPEQHHEYFKTLRQEIIDFAASHDIPREALAKPDLLRKAAEKLPTPDLERLATLLERFEYLLVHKEPREETPEALEYAEEFYHLEKQYTFQVTLLEQVGILKEGAITGIDGNTYPIPTLEQIAMRLFERRETLKTKHDQGFTKLLLVPFGMSLDALRDTLKQFLLDHNKRNPSFPLDTNNPLYTWSDYLGADTGDPPNLVYYPKSFDKKDHQGRTKMQILEEQENNQDSFPGWTAHFLQPANPKDSNSKGFAPIPRKGQGTPQGDKNPRPSLEAGQSPNEYLSFLQKAQDDEYSPYHGESGLTPEDWIMAFMIHLSETGKPLDNHANGIESIPYLIGAFFSSSTYVPCAYWRRGSWRAGLDRSGPRGRGGDVGFRSSVMI